MTEAEWLACTDPRPVLRSLAGKVGPRKMRLCAAACCRRVWHLLPDERCRRAVEVAERYADRLASRQDLAAAHAGASAACQAASAASGRFGPFALMGATYAAQTVAWSTHPTKRTYGSSAADSAEAAVTYSAFSGIALRSVFTDADHERWSTTHASERAAQVLLLRDVLGAASLPAVGGAAWRTADVVRLAEAAYEERTLPAGTLGPARLAVLADALEEAGCADAELLGHLRGPGPHVRGCWAIDLLTGRS
jgi:hypothetical protein